MTALEGRPKPSGAEAAEPAEPAEPRPAGERRPGVDSIPAGAEPAAARIGDALATLLAAGGHGLAAATVPTDAVDPIALFAAAAEADLEAALWLRPGDGTAIVGIGRAWASEAAGLARFRQAEAGFAALLADGRIAGARGPVLLGALGFSGRLPASDDPWGPFGPSSMVVPRLAYRVAGSGGTPTLTAALLGGTRQEATAAEREWDRLLARARQTEPGRGALVARPVHAPLSETSSQPAHDTWRRTVGMYAGAVGRGRIDKVVLARRVELRSPLELDVPNALRRLAATAPESAIYAFRRGGRTFLGATPERLVSTDGRRFRTVALAGTIRRGKDAAEDAELAAQLLASDKNREEQRIVTAAIRELLAPVAETLEVSARPTVLPLRYVQHLLTEISGTLPVSHGLLSVAALLHPTPAVGGEPREAALAMQDEHEGFERGWYAGPVGWLGADGDGELCVALRCGIVDRTRATLFAGCGIVADSDPDAEWEESRIKLRAVIAALGIPGDEA